MWPTMLSRPVAAVLVALAVLAGGILSARTLPVAELPSVDLPTMLIAAFLPGASPETMASSVAVPMERRLGQISGVTQLTSESVTGAVTIRAQFSLSRDAGAAFSDVQAALNAARTELPEMPAPPVIVRVNPTLQPILFLSAKSDVTPLEGLFESVERIIAQPLSQTAGVGAVNIFGGQQSAIRIRIDVGKVSAFNLSLSDVRAAIVAGNGGIPVGGVEIGPKFYMIGINDLATSTEDYRAMAIASVNGSIIRLGDIAVVEAGPADERLAAWRDGRPALFMSVQRDGGANAIAVANSVIDQLPQLIRWLPPSIELDVISDLTARTRATIAESWITMLITTLCVAMMVLFALSDARLAIISIISIPTSIASSLIAMSYMNYTIDLLSITALTIAVGFIVDDAIIMIECVSRCREAGLSPLQATTKAVREISFTIIAITISLVAALLPLIFVPTVVGRFLREFSVVLGISIIASGIVALTIIPILTANYMPLPGTVALATENRIGRILRTTLESGARLYSRTLAISLRYSGLSMLLTTAVTALTIYLYTVVPKGFIPALDGGVIEGFSVAREDISFAAMKNRQLAVSDIISRDPAVETVVAFVGRKFVGRATIGDPPGTGHFYIVLKPRDEREGIDVVIERLRRKLSTTLGIVTYLRSLDDPKTGAREAKGAFQFTLQSDDTATLEQFVTRLVDRLRQAPELRDVSTDMRSRGLAMVLEIDADRASVRDVSPSAISDVLYSAFGQRQVITIAREFGQEPIVIEADIGDQPEVKSAGRLFVGSNAGAQVPLESVTSQSMKARTISIAHDGQFPATTISFNLPERVSLGDATRAIRAVVDNIGVPPGVRYAFQGTAADFNFSSGSEPWLIVAAILLIYIILGILYESFLHPLTVLSTLPSAGLGGLLAVLLSGIDFTLLSFVGLILLIGIVKKNAIIMIDVALPKQRNEGLTAKEAIYQAALVRFRPIMMTTFTAVIGALPLALDNGNGSEFRRSLGIVVVGGLIVSQVLTLYTTPAIFVLISKITRWRDLRPSPPPV